MTPHSPDQTFHSSGLVRILSDYDLLNSDGASTEFAEKLAQWVNFRDAIELSALHSSAGALPEGAGRTLAGRNTSAKSGNAASAEFKHQLASLKNKITQSCSLQPGKLRNPFPTPSAGATLEDGGAYPPYRLYHQDQQREIETGARKLRAFARGHASRASPALQTLAALDARFENILNERETRLLARIPLLLEKRFVQLRAGHINSLAAGAPSSKPDSARAWLQQPDGWLARFCNELQTVLLAELDLRLEPAWGLIEALECENP